MAWVKMDDGYLFNAKVIAAGRDGRDLHFGCILFSARELTDGFIAEGALTVAAALVGVTEVGAALDRCLNATGGKSGEGLLVKVEGGYRIHDYLAYQPSREQVEKERKAARKRMSDLRGKRSGEVRANITRTSERTSLAPVTRNPELTPEPVEGVGLTTARTPAPARAVAASPSGPALLVNDPLYPPLVALFGPGDGQWDRYGDALQRLNAMKARPEEVPRRAERYPLVMPRDRDGTTCTLTLAALVKHWRACDPDKPIPERNGGGNGRGSHRVPGNADGKVIRAGQPIDHGRFAGAVRGVSPAQTGTG